MATSLDEAFALVVLKNNYFAWLLEAKQNNNELVTDYDSNITGKKTLVEFMLNGTIVELGNDNKGNDYILWKKEVGSAEYGVALIHYKWTVSNIHEKVEKSTEYKKLTDAMIQLKCSSDNVQETEKSRRKRQRKVLREMKVYTGVRVGEEKAYKGWSGRTFVDLLEVKMQSSLTN